VANFNDMEKEDILELISNAISNNFKRLDLSNRDIQELPNEIGKLTGLEHLNLCFNRIQTLPPEIGNLKNLKTLLLSRNEIVSLPPEIGNLKRLNLLDLSHNRILELPDTIGHLSELKTLDASYGQLQKLPLQFIELLSLKKLYLENNPLTFPPAKVVKRGLYATMYFLLEKKRKIETSKVILQVFNIPEKFKEPLNQYIKCFADIVSTVYEHDMKFEINFLNPTEIH